MKKEGQQFQPTFVHSVSPMARDLSFQFGSKIFTCFKIAVHLSFFASFYVVKNKKFVESQLSRSAISKPIGAEWGGGEACQIQLSSSSITWCSCSKDIILVGLSANFRKVFDQKINIELGRLMITLTKKCN